jgi:hypothetical protein
LCVWEELITMIWLRKLTAGTVLCAIGAVLVLAGCSKFDPGNPAENQPPETTLSFSPDQGDTANYRVRMNWFGWDPDGDIAYFRTKWDEEDWQTVVNTDSVFLVSASGDTVNEERGYEFHTFSVKAVDDEGAEDQTPEEVSFTAYTIVPNTRILRGPSGVTGPMFTFEWQGSDRDGVIVGYQYRLWAWTGEPGYVWGHEPIVDSGPLGPDVTSWTDGPYDGLHKFEVWATDDAGAPDLTPATRQFTCNSALAGPKLYLSTNVFGNYVFQGPVWSSSFNLPTPIFAGERLRFFWVASARDYGGEVLGYRHAYDDTTTWPAWSLFDTRFQVIPTLGRHSLYVSALDNANVMTRARIYFEVVEASLNDYILVVDDYNWLENQEIWGTDADRSAFYDQLLAGYSRPRFEWEPSQHTDSDGARPPDVDALRGASTVIWYADYEQTTLRRLFDPNTAAYNALAGYLRVGGNLVMCGDKILEQVLYDPYPIEVADDDTSQAAVFVRDFLHIGSAENSGQSANKNSPWRYGYCFYGAVPTDEELFTPMYIDSLGKWWPLYGNSNPNYRRGGLSQVEKLTVFQGTAVEIFEIDAYLNMNYEGRPCAVLYLSGDSHGNVAYFGFPFYYLQTDQVQANMDVLLRLFGEEKLQ